MSIIGGTLYGGNLFLAIDANSKFGINWHKLAKIRFFGLPIFSYGYGKIDRASTNNLS